MNVEELKERLLKFWNDLRERVQKLFEKLKKYFRTNERPNQITSINDYLEQKKRSEPFYKATQKNRKPWE